MATPVLHYFPAKGRAEAIRLAFALGGIKFEDHRFPGTEWPTYKPTTPWGGAPWLTVGDQTMAQSNALLLYAARLAKLVPADPWQEAKALEMCEVVEDLGNLLTASFRTSDQAQKKAMREELMAGPLKDLLTNVGKALQATGGGYVAGGALSFGDLKLFAAVDGIMSGNLDFIPPSFVDNFPAVKAHYELLANDPKIKAAQASYQPTA